MRQILFNLLANALKFTKRGGVEVRAGTAPLGDGATRVTLAVRDTGIGLSDEQRARLFQPFAQADSSTTRRFGGTGLGLSIVRRLTELMGGNVDDRKHAGRGLDLHGHADAQGRAGGFAARRIAAARGRGQAGHVARRGSERLRVLVVDDHPVNREVLVRQLDLHRACGRQRQRRRRGAGGLGGRPLHRGAGRHPHAAHGRLRAGAPHPRAPRPTARKAPHARSSRSPPTP